MPEKIPENPETIDPQEEEEKKSVEKNPEQKPETELEKNEPGESDQEKRARIEKIKKDIDQIAPGQESGPIFQAYQKDRASYHSTEPKSPWRRILTHFNVKKASSLYDQWPQVAEGNDPESENYYLKELDRYNAKQERRAEKLGFDQKIAFISHIHSRGTESWKDGSDGSLTVEELFEEYKKAVEELKAQGIDQVYMAITDHQGIGNSLKLAKMLEAEGVAKPIVGIEVANNEGYETMAYTTDTEELEALYKFLEERKSRVMRYGKTGYSGQEVIDRLKKGNFVIGLSHPSAKKTITMGGALIDRIQEDPEFRKLVADNVNFFEAVNWFQNTHGSNCLSCSMIENMEGMGVLPFNGEDFHSKVSGSEGYFLNSSMFNEIRTDREISSGEDLLQLLRDQKSNPDQPVMVNMLRGRPALAEQYNEHINNAAARIIPDTLKSLLDFSQGEK